MAWVALSCPQCGAPLPRLALWRSVKCVSCGSLIIKTESTVARDTFRQALLRARRDSAPLGQSVQCGRECFQLIQHLGTGAISQVYSAVRTGPQPFLATIKLSSVPAASTYYGREADALRALQAADAGSGGAYFTQHLPEIFADGVVEGNAGQYALILRHPTGFWGSLEALNERYPEGLDPRHAVWIWRRMLAALGFAHRQGWAHGDIRPEHALVHPQDHGVRLIGWASAKHVATPREIGADLLRSARVVLVVLKGMEGTSPYLGHVPTELAELLTHASQDEDFCSKHGAEGLDTLLRTAARVAFGPPAFVPLPV